MESRWQDEDHDSGVDGDPIIANMLRIKESLYGPRKSNRSRTNED